MPASIAELLDVSGVAFGTSGARGLVSAMTDRVCHGYTWAFLNFLAEEGAWAPGGSVALAGDLRSSTPRILTACAQAVRDLGGEVIFCGHIPTPALALWAIGRGIPSIMVTGSHIPDDRNGIKFYRPDGEILKDDEAGIKRQSIGSGLGRWTEQGALLDAPALPPLIDAAHAYCMRYSEFFGADALFGLKIGVYQHSAVGRDVLVRILKSLGATVFPLGRSQEFVPVDTEAVRAEDIERACQWAVELDLDALVSTDGDSDRPLLADHKGEWLRGDVLGVLCARAIGADSVVTPISSNTLVEKCGFFRYVQRTRIGSPYVIEGMNGAVAQARGAVCGYEANGGFLLASDIEHNEKTLLALPTRDAVLPIIAALVASRPNRLRDLVSDLPQRFTFSGRLQDFASSSCKAVMHSLENSGEPCGNLMDRELVAIAGAPFACVDRLDGLRITFANDRIIHLRGSGNAPELRCYTEAESAAAAADINRRVLELIAGRFLAA